MSYALEIALQDHCSTLLNAWDSINNNKLINDKNKTCFHTDTHIYHTSGKSRTGMAVYYDQGYWHCYGWLGHCYEMKQLTI